MTQSRAGDGQRIHVLLPVHNRRALTRQCIEGLLAQTFRALHLVVIDDGSNDGTADMVRTVAPQAAVITGDGSLWWAGCLQKGLDWLKDHGVPRDDIVLFLNDDTILDKQFVENGVRALTSTPRSMLLAQAYSSETGRLIEVGVRVDWAAFRFQPVADIEEVNCLSTRGLFMRLGDALRCGGFRPRLLPHYLSDYEFTIRAYRKGIRPVTDSRVKLVVNEAMTGQRFSDKSGIGPYFRSVFTKRSVPNPFYWTSFLLMACPPKFLPRNLARVWKGFLVELRVAWRADRAGRAQ
jgi:GT2 family glycosyltransferase